MFVSRMVKAHIVAVFGFILVMPASADTAAPVPPPRAIAKTATFRMQDGKSIYERVCQGCHMPGAKGAAGAGMYPALARNPRLEEVGYPVAIIISGQKAMPSFGALLNDAQIAEVVTYIRTHFGNRYTDKVTAAVVKTMR
jgi:mono/diheme cytochrome c family protein